MSQDYAVKDISLAEWGRKEIAIAETEMPGLMATREEFGPSCPCAGRAHRRLAAHDHPDGGPDRDPDGARRRGALVLLQHLFDPGPRGGGDRGGRHPVFAYKGESLQEYWDYSRRIFEWADGGTPNMILDDGGDATLFVHLGLRAEQGDKGFLRHAANEEEEVLFALIARTLEEKPGWFAELAKNIRGVTEETTTGVHRLYQMHKEGNLLFPAINVNDSVTKSKFDNLYGCRESLVDGIRRGTDVMMAGKVAMVAGFGDVGKGSAAILAQCRLPRDDFRDRSHLRAAGRDGRL